MNDSLIENINKHRQDLLKKQEKIDAVVNQLSSKILIDDSDNKQYTNYRKKRSTLENTELIRAFVELQKLSVDISKSLIGTYEREFKLQLDKEKIKQADDKDNESITSLSKLVKSIQSTTNN